VLAAAGHEAGPVQAPRPAGLSEREAEVLMLLARGLVTKQIAYERGVGNTPYCPGAPRAPSVLWQ